MEPTLIFRNTPSLRNLTISNTSFERGVPALHVHLGNLERLTFILYNFTPNEVLPSIRNTASTLRELELGYLAHVELPVRGVGQATIELPQLRKLTLSHSHREAMIRHESILTRITAPKLECLHVVGKMNTGEVESVREFLQASGCATNVEELAMDGTRFDKWLQCVALIGELTSLRTLAIHDLSWRIRGLDPLLKVLIRTTEVGPRAPLPRIDGEHAPESFSLTVCPRLRRLELECLPLSSQILEDMVRSRIRDSNGDDDLSAVSYSLDELVLRRRELDAGDLDLKWSEELKQ
ncbi:hypothetical protein BDV98DRAFT_567565 [Pterulicium gracile]|uniref:F-box domain-containing protein n=1 Tax=Pterulicium gracile TaxID=1884261 RepID=A0A5C3QJ84_9AGAR|nr:hypothetical protein BDV98DRAFT_567565 [Pterula gracilis]